MCKYLTVLCVIVVGSGLSSGRVVYSSVYDPHLRGPAATSFSYRIDKFPIQKPTDAVFYVPVIQRQLFQLEVPVQPTSLVKFPLWLQIVPHYMEEDHKILALPLILHNRTNGEEDVANKSGTNNADETSDSIDIVSEAPNAVEPDKTATEPEK